MWLSSHNRPRDEKWCLDYPTHMPSAHRVQKTDIGLVSLSLSGASAHVVNTYHPCPKSPLKHTSHHTVYLYTRPPTSLSTADVITLLWSTSNLTVPLHTSWDLPSPSALWYQPFTRPLFIIAIPTILYSYGGTQFTAWVMNHILQDWGVQYVMLSHHYPQSNGFAKATAKAKIAIMWQCWEINSRIMNADKWSNCLFQATPHGQTAYPQPKWCTGTQYWHPAHEWQCSIKEAYGHAVAICHLLEHMYIRTALESPQLTMGNGVAIQDHCTREWDK